MASAAAKAALRGCVEHLDARRRLEVSLLGQYKLQELLGELAQVPPDYHYTVWRAVD
jgi:hypothetical protein